ncbi:hypothetical protein KAURM247S_01892 [Kitasatospora aureofaciens]
MSGDARVIVGVSGSLHSLTTGGGTRARRAVLVPVLAWTPVGGERSYRARPCPPLLRAWQDAAEARLERRSARPSAACRSACPCSRWSCAARPGRC